VLDLYEDLNEVMLTGHLLDSPTAQKTTSGRLACQLSVCVHHLSRNPSDDVSQPRRTVLSVVTFDREAVNAARFLGQGSSVAIEGWLEPHPVENPGASTPNVNHVIASFIHYTDVTPC
jgi:single-stranded DNA-binding protein